MAERDFYKIAIVGASGKGKTFSFRNMDPNTTGFINVENKPLPFKNNFKYHSRPTTTAQTKKALAEFSENPEIKVIVLDSFSAYVDTLLAEARATRKGFDVWSYYAEEIGKLLIFIKNIKKEVFVTAHYEILGVEGAMEKRIKVKGKEWEGIIEKEFTVVLYTETKTIEGEKPEYIYKTFIENTSTKCPPDIINTLSMDNDAQLFYDHLIKFLTS